VNAISTRHPALLVIADDLSGAADCAMAGTRAGLLGAVCFGGGPARAMSARAQPVDVLAVDVDSRRASAVTAAERHAAAWRAYAGADTRLYKKLDSTLRGNVGAEIAALVPLAGMAIVAPALPAQGRTTRDGRQYLDGLPVEASEPWRNEGITGCADLREMLGGAGLRVAVITLDVIRASRDALAARLAVLQADRTDAVVCDAQTDADLQCVAAASATMPRVFWAGSAGLASPLITALGMSGSAHAAPDWAAARRPVLTVVGSMSSVSHGQAARLKAAAGAALHAVELEADAGQPAPEVANAIGAALGAGRDVLVTLSQATQQHADGPALCQWLASLLAPVLPQAGALIATGGETARALLATMGIDTLRIVDEVEPGLPLLVANPTHLVDAALPVVTKAGAFGAPDALVTAWRRLTVSLPNALISEEYLP
jgi:4-hydroxythreonine-4-phosphate dehydrogenase